MSSTDDETIRVLRGAMAVEVRGHHLDPGVAATALGKINAEPQSPRRRRGWYTALAASVAVIVTVALVYLVAGSSKPDRPIRPSGGAGCAGAVVTSPLPNWARAGFFPGASVQAHVTGAHDEIIGVLFANPLRSPPAKGHQNKILWVAKDGSSGVLKITATLVGSTRVATRTIAGGPGPSIINMPAPGCWRLTLTWSGHRDTLALPYSG